MENLSQKPKFFLGAMSKDGFASDFADIYNAHNGWHAFILKGGPGTGKSTLMKNIALYAIKLGERIILSPCSSDPDSLDAVILPDKKCVVMDGTAPHTVDAQFPIICENIINLGECVNANKAEQNRENIFAAFAEHKNYVARAARYIRAAAQPLADNYFTAARFVNADKIKTAAKALIGEYLPKGYSHYGSETYCRLSAVTPKGVVYFGLTPMMLCGNTVVIEDEYGAASNMLLRLIQQAAREKGCNAIIAKNPLFPNTVTDAVMLPECSVAFCRQSSFMHPKTNNRIIHARRFIPSADIKTVKQKLNFNKRVANTLLSEAVVSMQSANMIHTRLEQYYISAMDFSTVNEKAEYLKNIIFKKDVDK